MNDSTANWHGETPHPFSNHRGNAGPAYKLVDLTLPLANRPGHRNPSIEYIDHAMSAVERAKQYGIEPHHFPMPGIHFAGERVRAYVHGSGTHVDAPWHFGPQTGRLVAKTIDQLPLEMFWGPGIYLDFVEGGDDSPIGPEVVDRALAGASVVPGTIVLLRQVMGADPWDLSTTRELTRQGAEYLLDMGVRVIGTDSAAGERPHVESLKGGKRSEYFPVHHLGRERDFSLVELLTNLQHLPSNGFYLSLFPISIAGGSGAWCRAVAFVPLDPPEVDTASPFR